MNCIIYKGSVFSHELILFIVTCYPVRSGGGIPAGSDLAGSEVIGNIFPLVADSRYARRLHFDLLRFKSIFAVWSSFYEFWTIWRNPFNLIIFCDFSFYGFIWSVGCLHQYEQNITQGGGNSLADRGRFCPISAQSLRL